MSEVGGAMSFEQSSPETELFADLAEDRGTKRGLLGFHASVMAHVLAIAALVLVPILLPSAMPDLPDNPIVALIYNPPPPPPPPKLLGVADVANVTKPAAHEEPQRPDDSKLTVPKDIVPDTHSTPEKGSIQSDMAGSPTGSAQGDPNGSDDGEEGGVIGGVKGGKVGGCIGCSGDGPVVDYEQGPRAIRTPPPQYPQEAFVKKIEGTVVVEIIIDATGKVISAKVIKSIPQLDEAARQTVFKWLFAPAVKRGRPVASLAHAPVTFTIY